VQDRYAGDVGDFLKLGLLRALIAGNPSLRLGVNWYLAPDEGHNADGKHVAYLQASNPHHLALRACDPDLMVRLAMVVASKRSVAALERSGALPEGTITYDERVPRRLGLGRQIWHQRAREVLADADLIFCDPDNGIRAELTGTKSAKFAHLEELADYTTRGQSLVVYQHADRSGKVETVQVPRRLAELAVGTGMRPLGAVVTHRGTSRFFFVISSGAHCRWLADALGRYASRWATHADFVQYQPRERQLGM